MRFMIVLPIVILLAGCAEHQQMTTTPYLASKILVLQNQQDTEKYWTLDTSSVRLYRAAPGGGCATFEAIIDSNGRVFILKQLATEGAQGFAPWALQIIANERYQPAVENPNKIPVQTVLGWYAIKRGDRQSFMNGCKSMQVRSPSPQH